jgi:hypothetical protein
MAVSYGISKHDEKRSIGASVERGSDSSAVHAKKAKMSRRCDRCEARHAADGQSKIKVSGQEQALRMFITLSDLYRVRSSEKK